MNAVLQSHAPSSAAREFLARRHQLFIGGQWVDPAVKADLAVIDPATEQHLTAVALAGPRDIDRAVAAARQAFEGPWARINSHDRSKLLFRLADLIDANIDLAVELEVLDNGMPRMVAHYSIAKFGADFVRYYGGWCTKILGETIPVSPQDAPNGESLTYTRREPIGVVGAIIPWNAPMIMAILKIAPALAAGCTVVLKPAELTPLTALLLGDLIRQAGFPEGVVNIVPGYGHDAGAALAAHEGIDKIAFTGSTAVGKKILLAAAGNLKRVTLELGGKSPFVVFPDADLSRVIPGAARGAFFLQGQNCMAGTRLFVHQKIHNQVVDGIAAIAKSFKIGPGMDPNNDFGPLISKQQRDRVAGFVEAGRSEGGEIACGGKAIARDGWFFEPTIFANARPELTPVKSEIFGPVLCVETFGDDDLDDIARRANSTIYGLSGSVWTRDLGKAMQMVRKIDSGQVSVNMHAALDPAMPFGGNKQSGWGREFGKEGLEPYLKTKGISIAW